MATNAEDVVAARGWQARLELGFAPRDERTRLVHRRHYGPLVLQRPFYPEGAPCHVYLLHPPGGIVGGDRLELHVHCDAAAHALITTPAANKFYRSAGATARQSQTLHVSAGATLEWLPQEQILFQGARVDTITRVELAPSARFIGWEMTCLGRPASGEGFEQGYLRQRLEIWRDGTPLLIERSRIEGGSSWMQARYGLGGHSVTGTLAAVGAGDAHVAALREALPETAPVAATRLDDVVLLRYLGDSAEQARTLLNQAWQVLRPLLLERSACEPRIWKT